jgi:hypothetical protein
LELEIADTGFKAIHQSAERGHQSLQPPPIVNNFAGAGKVPASKLSTSASADGGNASGAARSEIADRTTVRKRTPARPQASTPRSDRTKAREAPCISATCGGARPPRRERQPGPNMNPHQRLARFAGFDWAKDHHDVVVLDAQGQIIDEFRFGHSIDGRNFWKRKVAEHPGLGVAVETSFGAAVEQLLASGVTVFFIFL